MNPKYEKEYYEREAKARAEKLAEIDEQVKSYEEIEEKYAASKPDRPKRTYDHLRRFGMLGEDIVDNVDDWTFVGDHFNVVHFRKNLASRHDKTLSVYERENWRYFIRYFFHHIPMDMFWGNKELNPNPDIFVVKRSDIRCYCCAKKAIIIINAATKTLTYQVEGECMDPHYSVEIDFPTGEVVINDFLRGFKGDMTRDGNILDTDGDRSVSYEFRDVNHIAGKKHTSEFYAKHNMLHMFVGNSSPKACLTPTGDIVVGRHWHEVKQANGDWVEEEHQEFKGSRELSWVCTDLWWTTIMDKSLYVDFVKQHNPAGVDDMIELNPKEEKLATIPPGRYRFTSYYPADHDSNPVYIRGVRIGDCK